MQQSKFTERQVVSAIKQQESGQTVKDICRDLGVSEVTLYKWKAKYSGMELNKLKRGKAFEKELSQC